MNSKEIRKELPKKTTKQQYRYAIKRLEELSLVKSCEALGTMNTRAYYLSPIDEITMDDYSEDLEIRVKAYLCIV